MVAVMGRVGEGVLGPLEDAAEVKDDCEACELEADPIELTRGDEVPDEYAWCEFGNGRDGTLSLLMYLWAA